MCIRLLTLCLTLVTVYAKDTRCPGGYSEGTTIDIGTYWYECRDGQILPKGCLTDNHVRIEIKETYDSDSYSMQCTLDSAGQLTLTYHSCVQNGNHHEAGGTWDDGTSWFTCERVSNYLRIESSGCMDQGKRVSLDEKVSKDDIVYQCKKNSQGTPTLQSWGCIARDGKQYAIGQTFGQDDTVYQCTVKNGKIQAKCIGCIHEQRHLSSFDRFTKDDVIYECSVEEDKSSFKPAACIARDEYGSKVEKKLGCYWIDGTPPYQYQMICKVDPAGIKAVRTVVKCIYKVSEGSIVVAPGCYQILDKTAVACMIESDGQSQLRAFQVDDNGNANVPGGLARC